MVVPTQTQDFLHSPHAVHPRDKLTQLTETNKLGNETRCCEHFKDYTLCFQFTLFQNLRELAVT